MTPTRSSPPSTRPSPNSVDRVAAAERYLPAARRALQRFPIAPVDLTPVWVSENVTFRVSDADGGGDYVLRLHRPGYHDLAALNSERQWTAALTEAGIGVPVGLQAIDGAWYVEVAAGEAGETTEIRQAGMTRWTHGEVLAEQLRPASASEAEGRFHQLGAVVAVLHSQAGGWTPPLGFRRHALDSDGLMGAAPRWGRFWESPRLSASEQSLLGATRRRLAAVLDGLARDPSRYSLIHADLHPGNVLVSGDRLTVIDFDDAAFGWHAYDIAVALFNEQPSANFRAIQAAFLAGYRSARALDPAIEALIPMFLLIRGLAVIGWLYQRPEIDPGSFLASRKAGILRQAEGFEPPL